jgi:hypothetical protein
MPQIKPLNFSDKSTNKVYLSMLQCQNSRGADIPARLSARAGGWMEVEPLPDQVCSNNAIYKTGDVSGKEPNRG